MDQHKPTITSTKHILPFERLSPLDFERLCLWLVKREGYERARHLGLAGSEEGRDVVAYKSTPQGEELWYFQCKRYRSIGAATLKEEVGKYITLAKKKPNLWPAGVVFVMSCAISARVEEDVAAYCEEHGLDYEFWAQTELDMHVKRHPEIIAEFFQPAAPQQAGQLRAYLAKAVAAYELRMERLVNRSPTPPDQPYKALYAFKIEDTGIFFGRDAATEAFYETVLKDRLTVLHAKSGAGKTSLLNAGLSPCLYREGYLPVYARAYDDPVRAVKLALAPPSLGPWPDLLPQLPLHEFLGLVCGEVSRPIKELVLILDQFEEFFAFWPEHEQREPLIDALGDCYDRTLPIHLVIGIRGDYFTDLADFEERIPTVFYNQYRLNSMTRDEAKAAIIGPAAKLERVVTYEDELLKTLLDDLARGGMELPHLQIICSRLYEELPGDETTITLASYRKLGRAEGVLGRYLQEVLDRLPNGTGEVAKAVLTELVSSEATKRVLSHAVLAARIEAEAEVLDEVLAGLVNRRLLHRDEVEGEIRYEMAHEYLIAEIKQWIDPTHLAFKQAEELLAREVTNWRVHGMLIPRERLELLYAHRERFKGLAEESWQCVIQSALQLDFALEDWARLAGGAGENFFLAAGEALNRYWPPERWWEPSGREEAAILLVGMERGTTVLLEKLADANPVVAARCLMESGIKVEEATRRRIVEVLLARMSDGDQPAVARAQCGDSLARLGDPRPGVDTNPVTGLPDILWCKVEAGLFLMGSDELKDPDSMKNERPQHKVDLPDYLISKYPITNAQYGPFASSGAYQESRYWVEAGWRWKGDRADRYSFEEVYDLPNHPVVNVSWYEAVAYCRWLTERLRQVGDLGQDKEVRLPTEAEWEKSARGTEGFIYPWGNRFAAEKCNMADTGIGATSVVGCSPGAASPYSVEDLSGNVWEWCGTKWRSSYKEAADESLEGDVPRVMRGGSYGSRLRLVRCACRGRNSPYFRIRDVGFRVVVAPAPSGL